MSEKQDKKIWHGVMRASERDKLHKIPLIEQVGTSYIIECEIYECDCAECYPIHEHDYYEVDSWPVYEYGGLNHLTTHTLDVSDVWSMSKDGKSYWGWDKIKSWCTDWEKHPYPRKKTVSADRYFYKDFKAK